MGINNKFHKYLNNMTELPLSLTCHPSSRKCFSTTMTENVSPRVRVGVGMWVGKSNQPTNQNKKNIKTSIMLTDTQAGHNRSRPMGVSVTLEDPT